MAYPLKLFIELAQININALPNKKILGIGSNNLAFDSIPKNLEKKLNIDSKLINKKIKKMWELKKNGPDEFYSLNKEIIKYLLIQSGFESYEDADINNLADNYINLNDDLPEEKIDKKFGIVIESGTPNYSTNIIKAYENVTKFCDIGGYMLNVTEPINFNRYPLSPSPNFILDFYAKNGFKIEKYELIKNDKTGSKLKNLKIYFKNKEKYLIQHLSYKEFLLHIFYEIMTYFFGKKEFTYIEPHNYHLINDSNYKNLIKFVPQNKLNLSLNFLNKIFKKFFSPFYSRFEKTGRVSIFFFFKNIKNFSPSIDNCNKSSLHYKFFYDL